MNPTVQDCVTPVDAEAVLRLLPSPPALLALGEPTHGEASLLEMRNALFRQLVQQHGFRTIAMETDCLMGLLVDDYVTSGIGTLDDVMTRGFSHEFGALAANRELVVWMRAYNEARDPSEQVHFTGFDGPLEMSAAASPRQAITALHIYLTDRVDASLMPCVADTLEDLLGDDEQWTNPAAMWEAAQSIGQSPQSKELRILADDLVALLEAQAPELISTSTAPEWDRTRLFGRTATGLLRYHFWMADTTPKRLPWLLAIRDSMMAANLLAIAERGPTLAHGHNSHFQRDRSSMRMGGEPLRWWSAGALVNARLGNDYAFVATALGTIRHRGVEAAPADTLEGGLYALPQQTSLVNPPLLAVALSERSAVARVSSWYGYAPLDPAHLGNIDGVVFVRDCEQK